MILCFAQRNALTTNLFRFLDFETKKRTFRPFLVIRFLRLFQIHL